VGEPINPAAWEWYHQHIGGGRCPIVDTFWQTETGGHMITPLPGATPLVPGSCTLPFPGIAAAIVDETGNDVPNGQGGILVIKKPWPSMIRTIYGDPERFKKSYYPSELKGYYLAGDGAIRDAETGYFTITGRIDDVLNVSGHRMGTMEIESALVSCTELVAEAAVVGRPDDTTGEAICAFVVLKRARPSGDEAKAIAKQLRDWVGKEIGPIAKPKDIRFGDNLPKTRSGKIMRRLLRSVAKGEVGHAGHQHAGESGDPRTAGPGVLSWVGGRAETPGSIGPELRGLVVCAGFDRLRRWSQPQPERGFGIELAPRGAALDEMAVGMVVGSMRSTRSIGLTRADRIRQRI
jgi:acyl-coenzyme A synthetase/AMP-(fatty) acid ligase